MEEKPSIRARCYPSDSGKEGEICCDCKYNDTYECKKDPKLFGQRKNKSTPYKDLCGFWEQRP